MRRLVTLVLACSAIALSFSAIAAAQRGVPTVALHIDDTKKADRCIPVTSGLEDNADCSLINTAEDVVGSYFVYILVGSQGVTGIGGVDLSINYDPDNDKNSDSEADDDIDEVNDQDVDKTNGNGTRCAAYAARCAGTISLRIRQQKSQQ